VPDPASAAAAPRDWPLVGVLRRAALAVCMTLPLTAQGFGAMGHRAAERVADTLLCEQAAAAVGRIAGERSLVGLGEWADRVRGESRWAHTAPWHYLNVPDGQSVATVVAETSDHVVWAIERSAAELVDSNLGTRERNDALRFFVHFVVDVHQPLHVGRADDRGGNGVPLVVDGEPTTLHRLWDTGVLVRGRRSAARLDADVAAYARTLAHGPAPAPIEWAEESRALLGFVYALDTEPSEGYLRDARALLVQRLAQAGVRLAARLNDIYCAASDP